MKQQLLFSRKRASPFAVLILVFLMPLLLLSHSNLKKNETLAAPGALPQAPCTNSYDSLIAQAAARYGISADFMCRVINAEGTPTYHAETRPSTYRALGVKNLSDPKEV